MTTNDAEVIQVNPGHCVQRNQHISTYFFNRLQKKQTDKGVGKKNPKLSDFYDSLFFKKPLEIVFLLCFHHCVFCL